MPDPPARMPLGQGALRSQLHLQLAGQVLPGELCVLADVRGHHPPDHPASSSRPRPQPSTPQLFDTTSRSLDPRLQQRLDQHAGHATQAEPAHRQRRARRHVGNRLRSRVGLPCPLAHPSAQLSSAPSRTTRPARRASSAANTVRCVSRLSCAPDRISPRSPEPARRRNPPSPRSRRRRARSRSSRRRPGRCGDVVVCSVRKSIHLDRGPVAAKLAAGAEDPGLAVASAREGGHRERRGHAAGELHG